MKKLLHVIIRKSLHLIIGTTFLAGVISCGDKGKGVEKTDLAKGVISFITNGSDVSLSKHPWQVRFKGCGGAIIGKRHILTAAHCVDSRLSVLEGSGLWAGGDGALDNLTELPPVSRLYIHPDYRDWISEHESEKHKFARHDIAIIELRYDISFNDTIQKIDLPDHSYDVNALINNRRSVAVTGWGENHNYRYPDHLQEIFITNFIPLPTDLKNSDRHGDIRALLNYTSSYPEYDFYLTYMTGDFIAYIVENYQVQCTGDSGGPMVDMDNRVLVGICAHGSGMDCNTRLVGYYSSVIAHLDWIHSILPSSTR